LVAAGKDKRTLIGTAGNGDHFSNFVGLSRKISFVKGRSIFAKDGFEFGTFGLFSTNLTGEKWLTGPGGTSDGFKGGMNVKYFGEGRVKKR